MIRHPDPDAGSDARLEPAGFPSPAADFAETGISLDQMLVEHRSATFFFRASGEDLAPEGIHDGDLLVVDRSLRPRANQIVVAVQDGAFILCPWHALDDAGSEETQLWGVVRWAIHRL